MGPKKMKSLTIRLPGPLLAAVDASGRAGRDPSELVRSAPRPLELDPDTRQYATLLYEIAKTRSVLLRLLDTSSTNPRSIKD